MYQEDLHGAYYIVNTSPYADNASYESFTQSPIPATISEQIINYSVAAEKTLLTNKYSFNLRKDFIERLYAQPASPGFSNSFSLVEEPYDSLLGGRRIEGQTTTSEDVQQTAMETEIQTIDSPPETAVEINIGSFNYSSY